MIAVAAEGAPPTTTADLLGRVRWLAELSRSAREEIAATATEVEFKAGQVVVGELEAGDEVYILLDGEAAVSVGTEGAEAPRVVATLGPGDAVGEMALITRELRSATVTALAKVIALRIERPLMETLMARFPSIAVDLLERVSVHLRETDRALEALLSPDANPDAKEYGRSAALALQGKSAAASMRRGSFRRAWRELVVAHRQELSFIALGCFVVTLIAVRSMVWLAVRAHAPLMDVLRTAFLGGLALLFSSTGLLLFRFRRDVRRAVAIGYGVGFALIFNELSVFLAFDVFWIDMTHQDTSMTFDPVALYTRSEGHYAVGIALGVLLQLTYLGRFYRRAALIATTRLRRLFASSAPDQRSPPA